MQGYLFLNKHSSFSNPYEEIAKRLLPGACRSVLLIDPSPQDNILKLINSQVSANITKRILVCRDLHNIGFAAVPDILKPETRRMIFENSIEFRAISQLTARILIVDDQAFVISGDSTGLNWGIELGVADSQPVIDFWEAKFHEAASVSAIQAKTMWGKFQEIFWDRTVNPLDVIALYNNRGAFIDVHCRIFAGYRQMTLHPFSSPSNIGPAVCWKLIGSRHFQAIGKQTAKIHGLKSLGIIRQTPAGAYLRHIDLPVWQHLFNERLFEFKQFIADYLSENYAIIREEALKDLSSGYIKAFREIRSTFIPVFNESLIEDQAVVFHADEFPDEQTLKYACHARYISYGLHPDAAADKMLMDNLAVSAVSDILL